MSAIISPAAPAITDRSFYYRLNFYVKVNVSDWHVIRADQRGRLAVPGKIFTLCPPAAFRRSEGIYRRCMAHECT